MSDEMVPKCSDCGHPEAAHIRFYGCYCRCRAKNLKAVSEGAISE